MIVYKKWVNERKHNRVWSEKYNRMNATHMPLLRVFIVLTYKGFWMIEISHNHPTIKDNYT